MTDDYRNELISAAFDGEPVDVEALRDALSASDGRDVLVSLLLLRAAVAADTTEPSTAVNRATALQTGGNRSWFFGPRSPIRVAAAACAAVLLVVTSFWAGTRWTSRGEGPPVTARTTQSSTPATVPPGPSAPRPIVTDGPPPAVNRVLRFTPGVDWHPAS